MSMPPSRLRSTPSRAALQTALIYAAIATGWILASDWLLGLHDQTSGTALPWQTVKGLAFVAVTSSLLFVLLRVHLRRAQASEQRFSTLVENLPGMVYRCDNDRNWTMRYVSHAARAVTGYEPSALVGNARIAYGRIIHAEDRERVWDQIQEALRAGSPFEIEYRLIGKDGTTRWIWEQGRSSGERDRHGRLILEGLMLDITDRKRAEALAKESAERLETLGDNLPRGAIYRLRRDASGDYRFTYASRGIEEVLSIEREQIFADAGAIFSITEPPYDQALREANERSARDLSVFDMELPQRLPNGERKWIAVRSMPHRAADGAVLWDGIVIDITERKRAELDALETRATLETALSSMSDAVMICDAEGNLIHINEAFAQFHRFERLADCPQRNDAYPELLEVSQPDGVPAARSQWAIPRALRGDTAVQQEYRLRRKDTGEAWIGSYNLGPIRGSDGAIIGAVVTSRDVTHEKAQQEELNRIAYHDPLTGLPNRRLFSDRLEQSIRLADRTGRSLAVGYLDLDGFKPINDRFGHDVGDRYLIKVAEVLRNSLRRHDSVARLGGDEFAVFLTHLRRPEDCYALLNRILAAIGRPVTLEGTAHQVSASIGVTLYPADRADPDVLLRHADQAMYRAKQSGKNQFHLYDAEQDRALRGRRRLRGELGQALDRNALVLHFQPQVDLIGREIVGAEALVRWQHPREGLLPPAAFLPAIKDSPLETALSDWVIETALAQLVLWSREGLALRVAVNVSAGQLMAPGFTARLREQLARHPQVAPAQFEIELLESTAFSDFEQARSVLCECHALGVRLALDDFGTGYSSLAYFRTLPFDVLKIDRSFVQDMLDDAGAMSIVESVVRLSQAFERSVLAEGIETVTHASLLTWLGCRYGQGFGIARPMPASELPGWSERWSQWPGWTDAGEAAHDDNLELLVAGQEHLQWVNRVIHALTGQDGPGAFELLATDCAFGRWHRGRGAEAFGGLDAYRAIGPVHDRVHTLADELLTLSERGRRESARTRLPELHAAHDALIRRLLSLVRSAHATKGADNR
ncbi:MAG: EAL domain-containing protein [Gammaproteobacteria bacterium]|jgi:diguanylate cyclase (GGDEF)-like protein/PAS domain S-box-containing protein|nr:EAL domain-containing protein [Gammaproteobacteria bacterium]